MSGLFDVNNRFNQAQGTQGPPPMPQGPAMSAPANRGGAGAPLPGLGGGAAPQVHQPGSLSDILAKHGLTKAQTDAYRYDPNSGNVEILKPLEPLGNFWSSPGSESLSRGWDALQNSADYTGANGSTLPIAGGQQGPQQRADTQTAINNAYAQQTGNNGALGAAAFAGLNLGLDNLAQQGLNLRQQLGFNDAQYGLSDRMATTNRNQNATLLDLAMQDIGSAKNYNSQNRGFAQRALDLALQGRDLNDQGFAFDEQDLRRNEGAQQRARINQYAAAGSWFTPENRLTHGDLQDQLRTGLGRVDLSRQGNELGRGGDRLTYDRSMAGLDHELAGLGTDTAENRARRGFLDQDLAHALEGNAIQHGSSAANLWTSIYGNDSAQAQSVLDWYAGLTPEVRAQFGQYISGGQPQPAAPMSWQSLMQNFFLG